MIVLPFPPATLSGHHNAHWRVLQPVKKKHREWARVATLEAKPAVPESGDIPVHVRIVPPDRRGDRTNYPNRLKPYFDGIADALGVNDRRFLPSYEFGEPEKPGRVEVEISRVSPAETSPAPCECSTSVLQTKRAGIAAETAPGPNQPLPDKEAM